MNPIRWLIKNKNGSELLFQYISLNEVYIRLKNFKSLSAVMIKT